MGTTFILCDIPVQCPCHMSASHGFAWYNNYYTTHRTALFILRRYLVFVSLFPHNLVDITNNYKVPFKPKTIMYKYFTVQQLTLCGTCTCHDRLRKKSYLFFNN